MRGWDLWAGKATRTRMGTGLKEEAAQKRCNAIKKNLLPLIRDYKEIYKSRINWVIGDHSSLNGYSDCFCITSRMSKRNQSQGLFPKCNNLYITLSRINSSTSEDYSPVFGSDWGGNSIQDTQFTKECLCGCHRLTEAINNGQHVVHVCDLWSRIMEIVIGVHRSPFRINLVFDFGHCGFENGLLWSQNR